MPLEVYMGFTGATGGLSNRQYVDNVTITGTPAIPEPSTMLLFGIGIAGLIGVRFRKKS